MQQHQVFVHIAKKYANKTAIVDRSTGRKLTYSRALVSALILAAKFKRFEKGFTGIMLPTSAGCILATMGVLMSGRTPVMINYSTGAADNADYARKKCDFRTIITSRAFIDKINCPELKGMVFLEDIMEGISALDKIKAALTAKLPANIILRGIHSGDREDNLVILFTSGSEKEPKAVQLTHKNILSNVKGISEALEFTDKDILLANLPYFHVFGLTVCLWLPLFHGMTVITYANPLDYKEICNIAREERPSIMVGPPSFFWGYLRRSEPGDFSSIRIAVAGADKCPDALRDGFLKKHNMTLFEGYGVTETSPVVSVNLPGANKPGSIGRVIPGVKVKIENYDTGDRCATGEVGKIMVKGDLVMKGYFDDIEETSLRIRHGWYDTGDMGFIDEDGYLWHAGRLKRFIKVGGEMVSLVRVEEVIEKLIPEDVSCCVVEVPDAIKGAKIAVAVTKEVDEKKLLRQMAKDLPNIALPKFFVVFEDLPKTGSGKIDFRRITEMVRDRLQAGR